VRWGAVFFLQLPPRLYDPSYNAWLGLSLAAILG
jgi:hypothetical protein